MKKIRLLMLCLFLLVGCTIGNYEIREISNNDISKTSNSGGTVITSFEDLNLDNMVGETITVRGKLHGNFFDVCYGLMDSEGFKVWFKPRGGREIWGVADSFTIKGVVTKSESFYDDCGDHTFIKEIKP